MKLLLVEDNPGDARLVELALREACPRGAVVARADRLSEAVQLLAVERFEAVLLDLSLPDSHGLATVHAVADAAPDVPIVVLTGLDDEAVALTALQAGAQDYLPKGTDGAGLVRALRYAVGRHQAEQELRRARDAAESANRAKSRFLSMVSHDVRTPLTGVVGYADLLHEGLLGELTPDQADAVERIVSGAGRLVALLNQVLDLARIESEGLELVPGPVDLRALLDAVRWEFAAAASAKGITLVVEVVAPLPTIVADAGRLRQVLANLVGNAIRFTERGSVTIAAGVDGRGVEVAVRDTGIGIAAADLPRLFDEYTQFGGRAGEAGSSGLGLAIARRLVELHGGTIRAESEPGVGSTFTAWLPATVPVADPEPVGSMVGG